MDEKIQKLTELIKESNNIVFFGGAGTSTESNIPDFRSNNGLYNSKSKFKYPPEVMLSHSFYKNHTKEFFDFYKTNMIYKDAKPNLAHKALVRLEKMGKLKAIITQNIDGLHQMAGSKNVLELHGSIHKNYCQRCGFEYSLDYVLNSKTEIPICKKCGGIIKPYVVLYEESLNMDIIKKSIEYISNADLLIVGGTSLVVYPAAGLIDYFNGENLVLINKKTTSYDNRADIVINDSIGEVLNNCII